MHFTYSYQAIVLKVIFISFVAFTCMAYTPFASAKTPTLIAEDIARDFIRGSSSLKKKAITRLAQSAKIPKDKAENILKGLKKVKNLDISSAGKLLSGVISKKIDVSQFKNLNDMFKTFKKGKLPSKIMNGLLEKVGLGEIPPNIANAFGKLKNLKELTDFKSLQDLIQLPEIANFLEDFKGLEELTETLSAITDVFADIKDIPKQIVKDLLGKVALGEISPEIANALSKIKDLKKLTDIKSLQDLIKLPDIADLLKDFKSLEDLTKNLAAITDVIADIAALPEEIIAGLIDALPSELVELLGGVEAITEALSGLFGGTGIGGPNSGDGCGASCDTCKDCATKINLNHQRIRAHVSAEFEQHRNWFVTNFFLETIAPAMALMTSQLTTTGMQQVQIIGSFFDAKHQLETQRLFQIMRAKAHKDYHPSEGLCEIGTNVRSLGASERRATLSHVVLANRMMDRQLLSGDGISSGGSEKDRRSRLDTFINKFCNKTDHAGGLLKLCKDSAPKADQVNMDIDYTNALDNKLTLKLNFSNDSDEAPSVDEENIFALSANLFANEVLPTIPNHLLVRNGEPTSNVKYLLDLRAIAAKRSVAQNSFAAITSLKTEGDSEAAPFLKAILAEAGIAPEDIENRLGENPSYYAQMEVMTKDLYQNPTFYSNLYDKPVNIERKGTALLALELMQDRDIYKSLLRSEAILATLIEVMIQKEHDRVSSDLLNVRGFSERMKQSEDGS
jgi:flagellar motility protein MotE (MotC chaperone)